MSNEIFGKPNQGINWKFGGEVKRSPYKVGVLICFNEDDKTYKNFEFTVDRNRFGVTIDYCRNESMKYPYFNDLLHKQVVKLSRYGNVDFEFMCTVILNYICCFDTCLEVNNKMRNQSIGFIVEIDSNNSKNVLIQGATFKSLEQVLINLNQGLTTKIDSID